MEFPPAVSNGNHHTNHSETVDASQPFAPPVAPVLPGPHVMKQRLAQIIEYERSIFSVNAPGDIVALYNRIDKDPRPFEPVEGMDENTMSTNLNDEEVPISHDNDSGDWGDVVYANNDTPRGSFYAQQGTLDAGVFTDSELHMVQPQPFETDPASLSNCDEVCSDSEADVYHSPQVFDYSFNTIQGPVVPDPGFAKAIPKSMSIPLQVDDPVHEDLRKAPSFEQHLVNVMADSSNVPNIDLNPPPQAGPSVTTPTSASGDPESTRGGKRQKCIIKRRSRLSHMDNQFLAFTNRTPSPQWLNKGDTIQICHWRGCGQGVLSWNGYEHHKQAGHYHRKWRKEGCLWMTDGVRCGAEGFVSIQQHLNDTHYRQKGGWCTCCGQFFRLVENYEAHLKLLP